MLPGRFCWPRAPPRSGPGWQKLTTGSEGPLKRKPKAPQSLPPTCRNWRSHSPPGSARLLSRFPDSCSCGTRRLRVLFQFILGSAALQATIPSVNMATTCSKWGGRSGPNSPRAASTIPGEQEAAKAAVVDEAALLAEDLCSASPQHGADRISANRSLPQWRSAGSFASGSRPSSSILPLAHD